MDKEVADQFKDVLDLISRTQQTVANIIEICNRQQDHIEKLTKEIRRLALK